MGLIVNWKYLHCLINTHKYTVTTMYMDIFDTLGFWSFLSVCVDTGYCFCCLWSFCSSDCTNDVSGAVHACWTATEQNQKVLGWKASTISTEITPRFVLCLIQTTPTRSFWFPPSFIFCTYSAHVQLSFLVMCCHCVSVPFKKGESTWELWYSNVIVKEFHSWWHRSWKFDHTVFFSCFLLLLVCLVYSFCY